MRRNVIAAAVVAAVALAVPSTASAAARPATPLTMKASTKVVSVKACHGPSWVIATATAPKLPGVSVTGMVFARVKGSWLRVSAFSRATNRYTWSVRNCSDLANLSKGGVTQLRYEAIANAPGHRPTRRAVVLAVG